MSTIYYKLSYRVNIKVYMNQNQLQKNVINHPKNVLIPPATPPPRPGHSLIK